MDYGAIVDSYKDMLHSLLSDFREAEENRREGEQFQMYLTYYEIRFIKELLEEKEDELDGKY